MGTLYTMINIDNSQRKMNRSDFGRMRYNGNINKYNHSSHKTRKNMKAQQYSEDDDESSLHSGLFSNSQTVLILTVVVGCFGVLWPKIFSPMFFGETYSHQDISDDAGSCKDLLFLISKIEGKFS